MFRAFLRDDRAAVSVMLVGLFCLLVACMALALDATRLYLLRSRLEAALYAGALAGGATAQFIAMVNSPEELAAGKVDVKVMNVPEIEDAARRFFKANFQAEEMDVTLDGPHIGQDGAGREMKIVARVRWQSLTGRFLGEEGGELIASRSIIRYGRDVPVVAGKLRLR